MSAEWEQRSEMDMTCPECGADLEPLAIAVVPLKEWWCDECKRSFKQWQVRT